MGGIARDRRPRNRVRGVADRSDRFGPVRLEPVAAVDSDTGGAGGRGDRTGGRGQTGHAFGPPPETFVDPLYGQIGKPA